MRGSPIDRPHVIRRLTLTEEELARLVPVGDLEWVTNAPADPAREHSWWSGKTPTADERRYYLEWRQQFIQGEPRATEAFTSEKLRAMGMIGLYRRPA